MSEAEADPHSPAPVAPEPPSAPVPAPPPPWRSPLAVWKHCLILFLTLGFYGFWWIYRAACDIRDRTGKTITAWLYPLALAFAIFLPFAMYNLAQLAEGLAPPRTRRRYSETWITVMAMLALVVYAVSELASFFTAGLFSIVPLAATLGLLQGRINEIARADPEARFARTAWRITPWQVAGMVAGSLVLAVVLYFTAGSDVGRMRGESLAPGERLITEAGFQVTPPTPGWVKVEPSVLETDGVLALMGPVVDSWAVLHVYQSSTQGIDTIVADRRTAARSLTIDSELGVVESRRLVEGTDEVEAWAVYSGRDIVNTRFHMYVTTLEVGEEIGEFIVYTPAGRKTRTGAEALARSLR